ncbi:hypothetical protein IGI04_023481 [Brassica rapa subsp. trilocularis]|uniref:Uncharacterized protein n=1 Tax=Brassica rapa subsp. trilocularis TaxID=1813537 RepID=A0ABQ7M413_BRACM|nr:hypothetical protein IGI04_023481 [Brassica rapa subsp. trilocularis]
MQILVPTSFGRAHSFDKLHKQGSQKKNKPNSWVDRTPFSAHQLPLELFREKIPAQAPGTLLLCILQRSRRKTRTLHQDMLAF